MTELEALRKVKEAALALSSQMIEEEAVGADFDSVEEEWIELTAALENLRESMK